jgi:hypothetical protein
MPAKGEANMPDELVDRAQRVIRNLTGKPVEEIPLENDPSTTVTPERRATELTAIKQEVERPVGID